MFVEKLLLANANNIVLSLQKKTQHRSQNPVRGLLSWVVGYSSWVVVVVVGRGLWVTVTRSPALAAGGDLALAGCGSRAVAALAGEN